MMNTELHIFMNVAPNDEAGAWIEKYNLMLWRQL